MKYQDFVKQVVTSVKSEVDRETTVRVKPVRRNNDFSSDGLNIVRDENIFSPTVFLDECYEEYLKGRSIGGIVSDITGFYNSHETGNSLDISYFYNFSDVESHLAYKLINFERNIELLSEVPFERFLDFAVVCYCLVVHPVFGTGSILIKNEHLDYWNVTKETLFSSAKANADSILPCRICSAKDELAISGMDDIDYPVMYMLTNSMNYYGAACMLYSGVLERLSIHMDSDLFILPSSVDEIFIINKDDHYKVEELKEMVEHINKNYVAKECFLSNNVYMYSRETKEILVL